MEEKKTTELSSVLASFKQELKTLCDVKARIYQATNRLKQDEVSKATLKESPDKDINDLITHLNNCVIELNEYNRSLIYSADKLDCLI